MAGALLDVAPHAAARRDLDPGRLMPDVMSAGTRPVVRFKAISEIVLSDLNNQVDEMATHASQADEMLNRIIQLILLKEYGDETGGISLKSFHGFR